VLTVGLCRHFVPKGEIAVIVLRANFLVVLCIKGSEENVRRPHDKRGRFRREENNQVAVLSRKWLIVNSATTLLHAGGIVKVVIVMITALPL